jgi:hypothetical protein
MRLAAPSLALAASTFAATALSQAASADAAEPAACPEAAVSLYFRAGVVEVSGPTEKLIDRLGEAARACAPARVELIASIDPAEGPEATALTLGRLGRVAAALADRGLDPGAIGIRAEAAAPVAGEEPLALREVHVRFRPALAAPTSAPRMSKTI